MQLAWIANWPSTDKKRAGWKIEASGSTDDSRSSGRANEKAMEAVESRMPEAMSCASDEREPSRESTDIE